LLSQIFSLRHKLDALVMSETRVQGSTCRTPAVIDPTFLNTTNYFEIVSFDTAGYSRSAPAQCTTAGTAINFFSAINLTGWSSSSRFSVEVDTFNSSYDTVLGAYPCTCPPSAQIVCNDNVSITIAQSKISVNITGGNCIMFIVSGKGKGLLNLRSQRATAPESCPSNSSTIIPGTSCSLPGVTCGYSPYCCCGIAPNGSSCYNTSFYTCTSSGTWSPNSQAFVNCQGVTCPTAPAQMSAALRVLVAQGTTKLLSLSSKGLCGSPCPTSKPTPFTACSIPSTTCYYDPVCCCQGTSHQLCGNTSSFSCGSSSTWSPEAQSQLSPCTC